MTEMPQCRTASPYLFVADVERAAGYYRDALGFSFDRLWGEPPCFVMVCRDSAQLMLSSNGNGARPNRAFDEHVWDAYVYVRDADALHEELNSPLKKSRPSDSVTRAWFESGASSWRWDDKGIDRWT